MIKLDLHLMNKGESDWKGTVLAAVTQRKLLEEASQLSEAESGRHIRPICLVQVERTGKDQRKAGFVHAEDAKAYLLTIPGILPEHIAIKSSAKDELKEIDDTGGLMSRDCPVRYIITKQALQEGWDCPFAYVLEKLRQHVGEEKDCLAEATFRRLLEAGTMRFVVIADHFDFTRFPEKETWKQGDRCTTRDDAEKPFDRLFILETKGLHLKRRYPLQTARLRPLQRAGEGLKLGEIRADHAEHPRPLRCRFRGRVEGKA